MRITISALRATMVVLTWLTLLPNSTALAAQRGLRDAAVKSTVEVRVQTSFGSYRRCSGYMFSTQGEIVTTYHAISDAIKIQVLQADIGVYDVVRIKRIDPRADVAVLAMAESPDADLSIARMGDSRGAAVGDVVHIVHHPETKTDVVVDTTIKALGYPQQLAADAFLRHYAQEIQLLEVDGPFDAGSAGGVVCDDSWNVIGMLIAGGLSGSGARRGYILTSNYLAGYLTASTDVDWSALHSGAVSDAGYFDQFFGPARQHRDFKAPMAGGYLAWFAPLHPAAYHDTEFTGEINDKIRKNWFYSADLIVDGKPLREISAAQLVVWQATTNPWGLGDAADKYMHFDADSLFTRRIYRNREIEERIMTRHILALALPPGKHFIQYENRGANYKMTGIKRRNVDIQPATVHLLDIQGLSLVQMVRLPPPALGVGDKNSVKYEVTRHPLADREVIFGIRSGWFDTGGS